MLVKYLAFAVIIWKICAIFFSFHYTLLCGHGRRFHDSPEAVFVFSKFFENDTKKVREPDGSRALVAAVLEFT